MNKTKIIKRILLIMVLLISILLVLLGRKFYLINKIMENVAKNNEIASYTVSWEDEAPYKSNFMTNGNIQIFRGYSNDMVINPGGFTIYIDKIAGKKYVISYYDYTYTEESLALSDSFDNLLTKDLYEEMDFLNKLEATFTWKVSTKKINGEKCYYIRKNIDNIKPNQEYEFWINIDNYCKVKATTTANEIIQYKSIPKERTDAFEFNEVVNLSGFTKVEHSNLYQKT